METFTSHELDLIERAIDIREIELMHYRDKHPDEIFGRSAKRILKELAIVRKKIAKMQG